jgi:hypothetical protein
MKREKAVFVGSETETGSGTQTRFICAFDNHIGLDATVGERAF